MPTFKDLLEVLLCEPDAENMWLLLDIKVDNNAEDVMRLISKVLNSVGTGGSDFWKGRISLGIWRLSYLPVSWTVVVHGLR